MLHELIDQWVRQRNTTWEWLFKAAGVSPPVGTDIRRGSTPRPETLRKLAKAMGLPRTQLFEAAGYVDAEDIGPSATGLSPREEALITKYRIMSEDAQKAIDEVVEAMTRRADRPG